MPTATANGKQFTFPEGTTPEQMGQAIDEFFATSKEDERQEPASPRMARGQQMRQRREENLATLREQAAETGIPLARDLPEIGASPELNEFSLRSLSASAASLFTFDDKELGDILTKQVGAEIVQDIEGNYIARMPSGESYAINKPGFSAQDVAKTAATVGAYTPAGRLASIPAQVAGGVATATAIEAGQKAAGGTFDPEEVAMEAGVPVALAAAYKALKVTPAAVNSFKRAAEKRFGKKAPVLIEAKTGLPTPAFEKALQKQDLTFSSIVNDIDNLPVPRKTDTPDDTARRIKIRKLESGSKSQELALYRLEPTPGGTGQRVVDDDLAGRAVKQGWEARDIQATKSSNRATRQAMERQLRAKRAIASDRSMQNVEVPLDIAGEFTNERFQFVLKRSRELGKELDALVNGVTSPGALGGPGVRQGLKGMPISTRGVQDSVIAGLEDMALDIPDEVLDNPTLLRDFINKPGAFKGSDIELDKTSQKIVKDAIGLLASRTPDAYGAHRIKKTLDNLIDYRKKLFTGVPEAGQIFAKNIRGALNDSVREVSPQYRALNDSLSNALGTISDLQDAIPKKVNLRDNGAASALGQELRKLQTHYAARQGLTNATRKLDDTVLALGGNFDVKITDLVDFDAALENRFGASRTRTFKGQIEEAGKNILRPTEGIREFAEGKISDYLGKKLGPDDEKAFNLMQEILRRD